MIAEQTVQKVLDAADILDVVGEFVNLHKAGANYKGLCPFHNEKTPSFVVSPAKQIFKCFGCGESGTAVSFLMKYENLSFPEAIKWLAKKYNIQIEEKELSPEELAKLKENETIQVLNTFAQKHFSHNLHNTQEGKTIALPYFKSRGFTDETINKFQLGYALNKRDDFLNAAMNKGYQPEMLVKAGLAGAKEGSNIFGKNKFYDRFRGRVIFPIHSLSGKIIAFGGRILGNDKNTAKYVNSPETALYNKSKSLYGIYYAKHEIVRQNKCFLVEGYTDVISMHQAGITNVVASSGTSLTEDQIRLIHRFTENITLIFDGDKAGIKAGLRGLDMVLKEDMNVRIVALPDGEDPDSFSKKMPASELNEYIETNEKDFILFKISLLTDIQLADPVKKSKAVQNILTSISVISDPIKRDNYIKETARLLDIKNEILYQEINKIIGENIKKETKEQEKQQRRLERQTPEIPQFIEEENAYPEEKQLLFFIFKFGDKIFDQDENITVTDFIINEIESDGGFNNIINLEIFNEIKKYAAKNETFDIKNFLNHPDDKIRNTVTEIINSEPQLSNFWKKVGAYIPDRNETFKNDIKKTIIDFKYRIIQQHISKITQEMQNPNLSTDEQNSKLSQIVSLRNISLELQNLKERFVY